MTSLQFSRGIGIIPNDSLRNLISDHSSENAAVKLRRVVRAMKALPGYKLPNQELLQTSTFNFISYVKNVGVNIRNHSSSYTFILVGSD